MFKVTLISVFDGTVRTFDRVYHAALFAGCGQETLNRHAMTGEPFNGWVIRKEGGRGNPVRCFLSDGTVVDYASAKECARAVGLTAGYVNDLVISGNADRKGRTYDRP